MLALRLTSTEEPTSMLPNSQTPKQSSHTWATLGTVRGHTNPRASPENHLEECRQPQVAVVRPSAAEIWQQGWWRPVMPHTPCWFFHEHRQGHCEEAACFRCQNTTASYNQATSQHKTQAQPRISPIYKWQNLRKLKWNLFLWNFISKFPFPSLSSQCKAPGPFLSEVLVSCSSVGHGMKKTTRFYYKEGGKKAEEKEKSASRNKNISNREWERGNKELERPEEKNFYWPEEGTMVNLLKQLTELSEHVSRG